MRCGIYSCFSEGQNILLRGQIPTVGEGFAGTWWQEVWRRKGKAKSEIPGQHEE